MDKIDRTYSLIVEKQDGSFLTISSFDEKGQRKPALSLEFDIQRDTFSSTNVASFRIFNLSEKNRNDIQKDQRDYSDRRSLLFTAGYGKNLSIIARGTLHRAWSIRQGSDFITEIQSFDGGNAFINANTSQQFPANTPKTTIIENLMRSMQANGVTVGAIGDYPGQIARGNSFSGSTTELLRELTGGGFFIDNGKSYALGDNEYLNQPGEVLLINSAAGLLGTPVKEELWYVFDVIFEPRLYLGQRIKLESETLKSSTNFYKVTSLKHRGIISDTVGGPAITNVGVLAGVFTAVNPV